MLPFVPETVPYPHQCMNSPSILWSSPSSKRLTSEEEPGIKDKELAAIYTTSQVSSFKYTNNIGIKPSAKNSWIWILGKGEYSVHTH